MTVIEFAEKRINDVNNEEHEVAYWAAYLDGSLRQKKEDEDAIERLQTKIPKWISVKDRLPEHGVHVLAACFIKTFDGIVRYYVCDAFHTEHFTETCNYDDDIDMEYNEEEDEYYMPEGWWEVIKNWDDYSCVAIADYVTHWMPLPEPPEVEG